MKLKLFCTLLIAVLPLSGIAAAQNAAEVDQGANTRSGTSPASPEVTPTDAQTVHTNRSGVVTQISVVNPTDIDPFSGSKRLSEWFDQLCTVASTFQRNGGRDASVRSNVLMTQARGAILELDEAAIPYLLSQLQIDPTGQVEEQLLQMRNAPQRNSVTLDYLDSIVLPSTRRSQAAQLLGDIGAPAEAALPVLVELWCRHSELERTPYFLGIQKIVHDLNPRPELIQNVSGHWTEYLAFETNVVAAAIEYCPQLPDELRSRFDPWLNTAEQGE